MFDVDSTRHFFSWQAAPDFSGMLRQQKMHKNDKNCNS